MEEEEASCGATLKAHNQSAKHGDKKALVIGVSDKVSLWIVKHASSLSTALFKLLFHFLSTVASPREWHGQEDAIRDQ
jgi:hypothetical protein